MKTPLNCVDEAHRCLAQASAIACLLGRVKDNPDEIPDSVPAEAAWAIRDLLDEARRNVDELFDACKRAMDADSEWVEIPVLGVANL